ncbi:MAG: DUF2058 domain-containing protein [Moraxellaceae bacterium]|nr:DUF2058 domain-containing protein [Moraxellaceae bacterium]
MASLKDQLLKAGVGNQKQARQADHARRQAAKGRVEGETPAELAQKAKAEQLQRDREANLKQQQLQAEKALQAQVKQMIETHRIDRASGQIAYQYTADKKVKKLRVTADQQRQLIAGQIAIVRWQQSSNELHELVPAVVAEKIRQRNATAVLVLNEREVDAPSADDPYADYPIPDDLMW